MVGKKEKLEPTKEIKDGTLKHFSIAGADKKWHWAEAKIVRAPGCAQFQRSQDPGRCSLRFHHEPSRRQPLQ
jgi:hypothetical protein